MAQKSSGVLKVIISLVVIVASIVVIVVWKKTRVSSGARPTLIITIDAATGKAVEIMKKPGRFFPVKHPDTGEKTLYSAYVCRQEKILFPGKGMVQSCPHCGSSEVGGFSIDEFKKKYKNYPVIMEGFEP